MAENSEKSFPFDADPLPGSGLPDRSYLAEDWARYFRAFISSGTFLTEPTNLQVITNGDMTVTLKIGSMIIDGYRYDNVEDIIIPVEPADGVLNRIDRVAITWSATDRDIHYTLQKGNMSYDPVAPECRRSEEYKDYVVADIMVNAGIINISQTNIIDQRFNSEVCGLAVPFVEINTKNIFLQLQAFYDETVKNNALWQQEEKDKINAWFNNIKNQLSGDAAVNLQNQIGTLSSLTTNNKDNLVNAINELNEKKINASAILKTEEQVQANTNPDNVASAVVVGEVINNLGGYSFGETADGKPGYRKPGADTVIPFSNGFKYIEAYYIIGNYYNSNYNYDLGRVIYDPTGIGDQKLLSGNGYYSSGWHTNISVSSKASGYQGLKGHTTSNSAITIAWIQ